MRWGAVIVGVVAASAFWLAVDRTAPPAAAIPPVVDHSSELAALRRDVAQLRHDLRELAEARAIPPAVAPPDEDVAADPEVAPAVDAHVEQRFAALADQLHSQPRDDAWAAVSEEQLKKLPGRHDYFAGTQIEAVECRSTWCRVVATHDDEARQGTFQHTVLHYADGFSRLSLRTFDDASPPRTELFLVRTGAGPLPR